MGGTLVAFVVLWLVLDRSAALLGSYRGEAGLAVCGVTLLAAMVAEFILSRRRPAAALLALGFAAPRRDALFASVLLCAALLAAIPLIAAHALLFFTMDFAIAVASLVLAVSISFPLAWLFERSGNSIWPPALVHAVVQGAIKLIIVDEASFTTMAVFWMIASALAPWLFFLLRPPRNACA